MTRTFPSNANFAIRGESQSLRDIYELEGTGMEWCGCSGARRGAPERMVDVSRGPGRLQRRLLELLEAAPERRLNREDLDAVLVEIEGFSPSNVLRAIRGLVRIRRIGFADRRHKKDSIASLPHEVRQLPDDEIYRLLSENGGER